VHEVVHYGVANMPGAVPRTSTFALTNTTLPYVEAIAADGVKLALAASPALAQGCNVWRGHVVHEGVAASLELPFTALQSKLG
jgi:alanine dehydrogenase